MCIVRKSTVWNVIAVALFATWMLTCSAVSVLQAEAPSAKQVFAFKPVQKGVEIETPSLKEYADCKVQVERKGKSSGWVVIGPAGQVLRRFLDTNADNIVDQWRYYNNGLEVYRDIDTNFNNKVDQSRWLNTGGSRWGIDKNEDTFIDEWKTISAEEASREAVQALVTNNAQRLKILFLTSQDIQKLGIDAKLADSLRQATSNTKKQLDDLLKKTKSISANTQWMRFDSGTPSTIPADANKAKQDLHVYENAMAITETNKQAGLIQIGELVRVGDTWKLTQIPQPLEGNSVQIAAGGILMQPTLASTANTPDISSLTPEVQKLLEELQQLDKNSPTPASGIDALTKYNTQRAQLLSKLVQHSKTTEERNQWMRQMIDGIAAAVQTGTYPTGLDQLKQVELQTKKQSPQSTILAYVTYRRLLSEYSSELNSKTTNEERQKVQTWWLKELDSFTQKFPKSTDSAEAMLQLAIAAEFAGKTKEARKWYEQLKSRFPETPPGMRASGALKRFDLKGSQLTFSGQALDKGTLSVSQFRGKVLLVLFWSTWCKPCTEDLPQMRALYQQYRDRGFEILGVNLDVEKEAVRPFLTQHRMTWFQIYEEGGLESRPARDFGIVSLPTMILVDKNGKVLSRASSVDDLKAQLPDLLKK